MQNPSPDKIVEKATGCNNAFPPKSSTNLAIMFHKPPLLVDTSFRQSKIDQSTSETYRPDNDDLLRDDPPKDVPMKNKWPTLPL